MSIGLFHAAHPLVRNANLGPDQPLSRFSNAERFLCCLVQRNQVQRRCIIWEWYHCYYYCGMHSSFVQCLLPPHSLRLQRVFVVAIPRWATLLFENVRIFYCTSTRSPLPVIILCALKPVRSSSQRCSFPTQ
jgi:hypothetical protein